MPQLFSGGVVFRSKSAIQSLIQVARFAHCLAANIGTTCRSEQETDNQKEMTSSYEALFCVVARISNLPAESEPGSATKLPLFDDLQKIRVESCPFSNLPAPGRNRWDQGLTAAEMKRCHWVKPKMVCQVKFTEWTRDDRLRQPVFLGIREYKNASEVVREKAS
jgi:ATP dependent DNA ligase C terminal region